MGLDVGIRYYKSPLGWLKFQCGATGLTHLEICKRKGTDRDFATSILDVTQREMELYFEGKLKAFTVPLAAEGTDFQKSVWSALLKIPYGKTTSYGQVAEAIDNPKSVRAVGAANGANPIAIIVPCHRVIGSDGSLTGYASGTEKKRWLLEHEGSLARASQMSLF